MKRNSMQAKRSKSSSLQSLEMALKDAKISPSPEVRRYHTEVDEQQLVSSLLQNVKKEHKWVSPFVSLMGHFFPDEYKEMVAADARQG